MSKNFIHNPDGSLSEVGPALDPETQGKVTEANRQYRTTGKEFKNPPPGVIGHRIYPSWVKKDEFTEFDPKTGFWRKPGSKPSSDKAAMHTSLAPKIRSANKMRRVEQQLEGFRPGTIKKAMMFVEKGDIPPYWKPGDPPPRARFGSGEDKFAHRKTGVVKKAQFPEKDAKIVQPELKPSLKPEAKEALQNWYRNVYKKGEEIIKAFRYTCGNCGHSDAVHTIGGHPQPTSWGCARCHADTKDIKPITEAPVPRGNFKTEPVFSEAEKKKVKETGGFFKAEPQFKWPDQKIPKEKSKAEQWRDWAAERIKEADAGKFKKGFGPPRDVQRQEAMDRRMERVNKKPAGGITFGGGPNDPRAKVNTKVMALKAFVGDKCPKCGGRMSEGAPHVAGNVKQSECHGCGHIEVTSRDA